MKHRAPEVILLCSLRFWARGTVPTVRAGVRTVARKQATPRALDKAERQLVKAGLISRPRKGAIAMTDKGYKLSEGMCKGVSLEPWDWKASYRGSQLSGARRRRWRK